MIARITVANIEPQMLADILGLNGTYSSAVGVWGSITEPAATAEIAFENKYSRELKQDTLQDVLKRVGNVLRTRSEDAAYITLSTRWFGSRAFLLWQDGRFESIDN